MSSFIARQKDLTASVYTHTTAAHLSFFQFIQIINNPNSYELEFRALAIKENLIAQAHTGCFINLYVPRPLKSILKRSIRIKQGDWCTL